MPDNFGSLTPLLAYRIEATPGTAEVLSGVDSIIKPHDDLEYQPSPNAFPAQEVSEDLGVQPAFMSGKKSGFTFGTNFRASGTVGTDAAVSQLLRACGLKKETLNTIDLTAPPSPGSFSEGASYTATGGKTGIIERLTAGTTLIYIIGTGGALASADVVTVGSDTATTTGADAVYSLRYVPRTSGQETLTIERLLKNLTSTAGAVNKRASVRGCMGNLVLSYAFHDIGRAAWIFLGVDNADDEVALWSPLSHESIAANLVGKLINATLTINGQSIGITNFSLDMGGRVELAPEPAAVDGGTAGYLIAAVEAREPVLTIDPRQIPNAALNELALYKTGANISFAFVSSGSAGHIIEILCEACQITGYTEGDINNRKTWQGQIAVNTRTPADTSFKLYLR